MKKLLATVAAVLVSAFALSNSAEAGIHVSIGTGYNYVSGHASCGCPIYTKRVVRGYNRYNQPIYNFYRQPFRCRGASCRSRQVNFRQHGFVSRGGHYNNRSHYYSRGRGHYNNRHSNYGRSRGNYGRSCR